MVQDDCENARGGGQSLKIGDGDAWPHWFSFINSLSPIDPFFRLALTQWPPFLMIHNQFSTISHRVTSFLTTGRQNFHFFSSKFFVQNVSKFVFCPVWLPFFRSSYWMTPFIGGKSLTKKPLVSSCCPSPPSLLKLRAPGWKRCLWLPAWHTFLALIWDIISKFISISTYIENKHTQNNTMIMVILRIGHMT